MGSHTWYKKPLVKGKENIIKYLKEKDESDKQKEWWNDDCEKEHQYFLSLGGYDALNFDYDFSDVRDYKEGSDYDIISYEIHSLELILKANDDYVLYERANGYCIDAPRIGGYPDTVIKSAEEMFKAMETGLVNWEGKHFNFYWDKNEEDYIRKNITNFFKAHPDGIITFG
jgi:hypothetical protein